MPLLPNISFLEIMYEIRHRMSQQFARRQHSTTHPIYTKRQQDVEQALKYMYELEVLFLGPEGDSPIIRLYNIIRRENSQQYPKP